MALSPGQQDELRRLWPTLSVRQLSNHFGITEGSVRGYRTRLHLRDIPDPSRVKGLAQGHPALQEGRSLFPGMVVAVPETKPVRRSHRAAQGGFVLVSGANSVKYGAVVQRGAWSGFPLFALTLEERRTCPTTCAQLRTCYGNTSHKQKRYEHGPALEQRLDEELRELQQIYPTGFLVRLHTLGDFYTLGYAQLWAGWLREFPALHVFGYTAWPRETEIGTVIHQLSDTQWDRFAVRYSAEEPGAQRAVTVFRMPTDEELAVSGMTLCPYETGKTDTCSTCALCWSPNMRDKTIAFLAHGK